MVQPSQSTLSSGSWGSPRASSPSGPTSPTAYLIQGEGGRMGSLVLQGQHPHFHRNQVRKRAQSLTPRGSASSAWRAGETVGAARPLLTQSPGQMSGYMSAQKFSGFQKPSGLRIGIREEDRSVLPSTPFPQHAHKCIFCSDLQLPYFCKEHHYHFILLVLQAQNSKGYFDPFFSTSCPTNHHRDSSFTWSLQLSLSIHSHCNYDSLRPSALDYCNNLLLSPLISGLFSYSTYLSD